MTRWNGRPVLWIVLIAGLASGCATALPGTAYRPSIPTLTMMPEMGQCRFESRASRPCVVLAREDWEAIVRELKAACLALGGSPEACQTEETR